MWFYWVQPNSFYSFLRCIIINNLTINIYVLSEGSLSLSNKQRNGFAREVLDLRQLARWDVRKFDRCSLKIGYGVGKFTLKSLKWSWKWSFPFRTTLMKTFWLQSNLFNFRLSNMKRSKVSFFRTTMSNFMHAGKIIGSNHSRRRTFYSISFYGRIMLWMDATVSKGMFISLLLLYNFYVLVDFTIDGKHML